MTAGGTVLVVGAGLAGSRCAEALRAAGYEGRIVLVGEEPHPPYERPALSKALLAGTRAPESLPLRPPGVWAELGIELHLGVRIARVDVARRRAEADDGSELGWDSLVLATGARPRRLPLHHPRGVHYLRTLDDALALRAELTRAKRLVVIGAGFVGGEVASTAAELGLAVTVVDGAEAPLVRPFGPEVASLLAARYRAVGIELRANDAVSRFEHGPDGRVGSVTLAAGDRLACDVALVGIGAEPAGELLGGRVETDAIGRTGLPGVYACGDVAAAWHPAIAQRLRVEHWTSASAQAVAVASVIAGRDRPSVELPYFWSDQLGLRLQYVGHAPAWARIELDGDEASFRADYLDRDGRVLAGLLANRPLEVGRLRSALRPAALPSAA